MSLVPKPSQNIPPKATWRYIDNYTMEPVVNVKRKMNVKARVPRLVSPRVAPKALKTGSKVTAFKAGSFAASVAGGTARSLALDMIFPEEFQVDPITRRNQRAAEKYGENHLDAAFWSGDSVPGYTHQEGTPGEPGSTPGANYNYFYGYVFSYERHESGNGYGPITWRIGIKPGTSSNYVIINYHSSDGTPVTGYSTYPVQGGTVTYFDFVKLDGQPESGGEPAIEVPSYTPSRKLPDGGVKIGSPKTVPKRPPPAPSPARTPSPRRSPAPGKKPGHVPDSVPKYNPDSTGLGQDDFTTPGKKENKEPNYFPDPRPSATTNPPGIPAPSPSATGTGKDAPPPTTNFTPPPPRNYIPPPVFAPPPSPGFSPGTRSPGTSPPGTSPAPSSGNRRKGFSRQRYAPPTTSPDAQNLNNPNKAPGRDSFSESQRQREARQPRSNPPSDCDSPGSCSSRILRNGEQANNKIDDLLAKLNLTGQGIDLGLLTVIHDKLSGLDSFLRKAWKTTHMDKVINMLNLMVATHNAAMLSRDLGQTLGDVSSSILQFLGIQDSDGNAIDVNEVIGNSITNLLKGILGESVYNGISTSWRNANRIISAASGMVQAIQSMVYAAIEGIEVVGSWVAKIGNTSQEQGVFEDLSFPWMDENPNFKNPYARLLEKVEDLEEAAESVYQLVSAGIEFQEGYAETVESTQELIAALQEAEILKADEEAVETAASTNSPTFTDADLLPAED